jgi:hypothetical protein
MEAMSRAVEGRGVSPEDKAAVLAAEKAVAMTNDSAAEGAEVKSAVSIVG